MGLTQPVLVFLGACALGFLLGALYDVFRILRLAFSHPAPLVFVEDALYFFAVTVLSFSFILLRANGVLRAFLLLGELLGAVLYFFSLSLLLLRAANLIIRAGKAVVRFLFRITLLPVWRLLCQIGRGLRRICRGVRRRVLVCRVKHRKKHAKSGAERPFFEKKRKLLSFQHKKHLKPVGKAVYNDGKQSFVSKTSVRSGADGTEN